MKRIGIVGTRQRDSEADFDLVVAAFLKVYELGDVIISGGCLRGGDRFAAAIASKMNIPIKEYLPDWENYPRLGGFIRNTRIAGDSDILIACIAKIRKGGTEDTINKFKRIRPDGELILI